MSIIACDGTIDDPIPEYDVLAAVNEDDGQKNYLVYGSAYFIDVFNYCLYNHYDFYLFIVLVV